MSLLKNEVPGPYHKPRTLVRRHHHSLRRGAFLRSLVSLTNSKDITGETMTWVENVLPREAEVDYRIV